MNQNVQTATKAQIHLVQTQTMEQRGVWGYLQRQMKTGAKNGYDTTRNNGYMND